MLTSVKKIKIPYLMTLVALEGVCKVTIFYLFEYKVTVHLVKSHKVTKSHGGQRSWLLIPQGHQVIRLNPTRSENIQKISTRSVFSNASPEVYHLHVSFFISITAISITRLRWLRFFANF